MVFKKNSKFKDLSTVCLHYFSRSITTQFNLYQTSWHNCSILRYHSCTSRITTWTFKSKRKFSTKRLQILGKFIKYIYFLRDVEKHEINLLFSPIYACGKKLRSIQWNCLWLEMLNFFSPISLVKKNLNSSFLVKFLVQKIDMCFGDCMIT